MPPYAIVVLPINDGTTTRSLPNHPRLIKTVKTNPLDAGAHVWRCFRPAHNGLVLFHKCALGAKKSKDSWSTLGSWHGAGAGHGFEPLSTGLRPAAIWFWQRVRGLLGANSKWSTGLTQNFSHLQPQPHSSQFAPPNPPPPSPQAPPFPAARQWRARSHRTRPADEQEADRDWERDLGATVDGQNQFHTILKSWDTVGLLVFTEESSFQGILGGAGFKLDDL